VPGIGERGARRRGQRVHAAGELPAVPAAALGRRVARNGGVLDLPRRLLGLPRPGRRGRAQGQGLPGEDRPLLRRLGVPRDPAEV
jgi:hypothetical protein